MVANRQLYATSTSYHPPADIYDQQHCSMLLTYLEQQNKRRLLAARQRQQDASTDVSQPARASTMLSPANLELPSSEYSALYNHQMLAMVLEQQNKKRPTYHLDRPAPGVNFALQDYQMQLMLLEQQKKKRVLMLRRGQTAACSAPSHSAPDPTGQKQA